MIIGTLILLTVEWYGIADFLYDFAAYPLYCTTAVIIGAILFITYIFALYSFYLYRLYKTFGPSSYALKKRTIRAIVSVSVTVYIFLIIFVFLYQRSEPIQVDFSWDGMAKTAKPRIICKGEFSIGLSLNLRVALQCIIIGGNLFYGWLFHYKLHQILKGMTAFDQVDIETNGEIKKTMVDLYKLMKSQTILVTLSTCSTLIFWSATNILHLYGSYAQIFIYIDITINCLCLWLMFGWNQKYYKKYCICGWIVGVTCFKLLKNEHMMKVSEMKKSIELSAKKGKPKESVSMQIPRNGQHESVPSNTTIIDV